ncbi:MAG TPA: thiazole biosynthesis protein [Thermoplasmatales archaeon]|nr:thiazole biosynthesis protein [Thermoplasmatales archaeon]
MRIDEIKITRKIISRFFRDFDRFLDVDVAIAGAGPSGMTAARYLAKAGKKVVVFERKLSPGGGMWGGGMTFPVIIVQEESKKLLEEIGVRLADEGEGYYSADSLEATTKLCSSAIDAGAKMFSAISVEDVMIRDDRISGFVINWSAVEIAGLHVDPLTIKAKYCIDATGHAAEICKIVQRKVGRLNTPSGKVEEERSMCAELGEQTVVENTREVYPSLIVAGMAANAVFGAPRMGPIFGGMLLSGKKAAELILEKIG